MQSRVFTCCFLLLLFGVSVRANNLAISNVNRTGVNRNIITADISWENSWYVSGIPRNNDAVWIFVKFRECNTGGPWHHALLSTTMANHSFSSGITFATPITTLNRFGIPGNNNTGVMIRRNGYGIGDITGESIGLQIVGSTDGTAMADSAEYDINVLGIEMVYIPSEAFYIGDGTSTYHLFTSGTNPRLPYRVTSENAVTISTGQSGYNVTIPSTYPKGFSSFYIMKYEITQGQYVDFLNTIDPGYALNRAYIYNAYMYNMQQSGNTYSSNYPNRAMTYMSYTDLLSYLDWAALRPVSEMEFEKACRGPLDFVPGEQAWGEVTFIQARNVTGTVSGQEVCTDSAANLHYYGSDYYCHGGAFGASSYGPLEVGIFARDTTLTREGTGATYYGLMEMSGNAIELCVQVNANNSNPSTPSTYTGLWGDGILSALGEFNTTAWGGGEPFVMKGGSWTHDENRSRVSDRSYINYTAASYSTRDNYRGGRGCR
ncbi:MAG: hypothetical protein CVU11_05165 [Bacteroidetes bacterium HGW-Bacteroidetes-6]|jgi:formylglycine-generating enzyme required for sulfatase activity|nr:MAG: hypothetical protein CVU11_05165 [Bacteroidetes bacterium HGW-Bacteroidetes-6]